jgi:hypothetical protein
MPDEEVRRVLKSSGTHSLQKDTKDNLLDTNSLAAWSHSNVLYIPGYRSSIGVARKMKDEEELFVYDNEDSWLYPNYVKYCNSAGNKPRSIRSFSHLLEDLCKIQLGLEHVELLDKGNKGREIVGLKIRGEDEGGVSPIEYAFDSEEGEV